jgi:hypothetical protein
MTNLHVCSECGNEVETEGLPGDGLMSCSDHPSAMIESIGATGAAKINVHHYVVALRAEVERRGGTSIPMTDALLSELLYQYDTVDAAADYLAPKSCRR